MGDARARHLKRLRRLRRSARGWSVRSGLLVGATAVLVPYQGLGLPDAVWAAAAGGSVAVTIWRWLDLRALQAEPVPEPVDPALAAAQAREALLAAVRRVPIGRTAIEEFHRQRAQLRLRGLAVAGPWRRLERASQTLAGLVGRLHGPARSAVLEAAAAERALRELVERTAAVERALRLGPAGKQLTQRHAALMAQLNSGVDAYERLVAAAAGYVAEESPVVGGGLAEATDFLRGVAEGLAELRQTQPRAA
jgi:hypothetical protein